MRSVFLLSLVLLAVASVCSGKDHGKIVNPYVCTPGSSFKLDCNRCKCGPNPGEVGACTRMACPLGPDECIPGSYFQLDGKLCACPKSGNKWDSNCFRA